jgi:uncharacterized protein YjdB
MNVRTSARRGFALLALSSLAFAACDSRTTTPVQPVQVTVTVTPSNVPSLSVGQTVTLTAVVNGSTNQAVTWSSSDNNVATVNAQGVVTGAGPGIAAITARTTEGGGAAGSASVTVVAAPVPTVSLQIVPNAAPVQVGSTVQLVGIVGGSTNQTVNWTSRDTTIARVSTQGVVTGVRVGTAVIEGRPAADGTVVQTAVITVTAGTPTPQVQISVTPATATTSVGDSVRFVASVTGPAGVSQNVTWTSLTPSIASVNGTTGWATGIAPGTAVLRARAQADTSRFVDVSLTVTATPPPPPAPSISIASITTPGGATINPLNVAGQINATVNVSAVPANNVRSVALELVNANDTTQVREVCRQDFTPALGTTQSVATINCPINTAATDENGVPLFLNGNFIIRAVAFDEVGGRFAASAGAEVARAVFCPQGQQQQCVVTFNNVNFFAVSWSVTPRTSTGPTTNATTGLLWHEGDVVVTVRPALFTGGALQSLTQVCLVIPVADAAPGTASGTSCRTVASATDNAWTATFLKSATLANGGVSNVSNSNVTVTVGSPQLLVGGQQVTIPGAQVGPTPSPLRLDNVGPTYSVANFATLIGATDQYVGIGFMFTASTATGAAATVWNLADPMPGVGVAGVTAPTVTFFAAPTSAAGGNTAANNLAITQNFPAITSADELASQLQNNFYTLVVRAVDRLGNATITRVGTFGVDLVRPTNVMLPGSLADDAINPPAGVYNIRATDEFAGIDQATSLQFRAARWFNGPSGVDTRRCIIDSAGTFAGAASDTVTTTLINCPWVSFPLTPVGGQVYEASIPAWAWATVDGFYQYEIRVVDRAGNVSETVHMRDFLRDFTPPAGSLTNSLTIAGLGGTAIPQDSVRSTTTIAISGTVVDNIEVAFYDTRIEYQTNFAMLDNELPFAMPTAVGTYGLPLTESQNVSSTTPFIAIRNAADYTQINRPVAGRFGVWDLAENFGTSTNIAIVNPMLYQIAPVPASIPPATFGIEATELVINTATPAPTTTVVSVTYTTPNLAITPPIVRAYLYYIDPATGVAMLLNSQQTATRVLTGTTDRTFWFETTVAGGSLVPDAAGTYNVPVFAVLVDANNVGYYVDEGVVIQVTRQ